MQAARPGTNGNNDSCTLAFPVFQGTVVSIVSGATINTSMVA